MIEAIYLDEGELISAGADGYVRVSVLGLVGYMYLQVYMSFHSDLHTISCVVGVGL